MSNTTLLSIDGIDFSDYSTRGLSMNLEPIPIDSGLVRNVNGGLLDLTPEQFRKYQATISCTDQEAPSFKGVWIGKEVTVTCIPEVGVTNDTAGSVLTLVMLVTGWNTSRDEYAAETNWSLSLAEK